MKPTSKSELKAVHLKIPSDEYEFLVSESARKGISMEDYIANLLREVEKQNGAGIVAPKEAEEPFSLEFTELTDEELDKQLQAFEVKYQLDSETLYQLYRQGKAPDWIEDRILWAGLYELLQEYWL
jgi:hypothetical protein